MAGKGIMSDLGNVGAELFLTKGVPYLGKKAVEMGRYYTPEMLRDPKLQKKAIDYALDKLNPAIHNVASQTLNQLSTKIRHLGCLERTMDNRLDQQLREVLLIVTKLLVNYQNQKADGHYLVINTQDLIMIWKIN